MKEDERLESSLEMSVEQMRDILCKQYYNAPKWVNKVSKMPDRQIVAIYMRMLRAGKLR